MFEAIIVKTFPKVMKDRSSFFEEAVEVKESLLSTGS